MPNAEPANGMAMVCSNSGKCARAALIEASNMEVGGGVDVGRGRPVPLVRVAVDETGSGRKTTLSVALMATYGLWVSAGEVPLYVSP